jgi:anti-sigma regulatory factor (Ser/Thr protein kinase)
MRTGAAAGHVGHFHEAVRYASDDDLLAVAVPFLAGGAAAGEPTVVSMGPRNTALIRAALPAGADVTFLDGDSLYARPTGAIRSYRNLFADHVGGGATQIRVIGELSPGTFGATWDWWARYEAAVNHAYDEFPLWSMCAYDTRTTPEPVMADVLRTHPRTATPDGRHVPSPTYTDPVRYLTEPRTPVPDPIERNEPLVDLTDPSAAEARQAVRDADRRSLPAQDIDDLVLAVSEAVANACRHGRTPCRLRLWHGTDRVVVSITDAGPGPTEPFAGLLPVGDGTNGGLGLWIMNQMCNHVAMHRQPDGFTIRLTAGNPYH